MPAGGGNLERAARRLLTLDVGEVVLRRPPLGHVLATAHDMGRESRVMSALSGSAVPVPQVLAVCADDSVLGAPFYVMSKATGAAYGARVGCSCRFVGGRSIGDCRKDFEPGMGLVTLSADEEEKSVSARFLLLAHDKARFRPGMGCVFERWDAQGS